VTKIIFGIKFKVIRQYSAITQRQNRREPYMCGPGSSGLNVRDKQPTTTTKIPAGFGRHRVALDLHFRLTFYCDLILQQLSYIFVCVHIYIYIYHCICETILLDLYASLLLVFIHFVSRLSVVYVVHTRQYVTVISDSYAANRLSLCLVFPRSGAELQGMF